MRSGDVIKVVTLTLPFQAPSNSQASNHVSLWVKPGVHQQEILI